MNKQPWAYIDTMTNPDIDRGHIERNHILKALCDTVEGEMDECDGWFKIHLTTGGRIEYKYVFRPHRSLERKGESYFQYRDSPDDLPILMNMDDYLDSFISMGPIYGALTYYTHVKLGLVAPK